MKKLRNMRFRPRMENSHAVSTLALVREYFFEY